MPTSLALSCLLHSRGRNCTLHDAGAARKTVRLHTVFSVPTWHSKCTQQSLSDTVRNVPTDTTIIHVDSKICKWSANCSFQGHVIATLSMQAEPLANVLLSGQPLQRAWSKGQVTLWKPDPDWLLALNTFRGGRPRLEPSAC